MTQPQVGKILDILQADYARFPKDQTYAIYAEDVQFKDPFSQFQGLARYRQMIGLMETWFRQIHMDLHSIDQQGDLITTRWTLQWIAPMPWQPKISVPGCSELQLNAEGLIASHIDYWDCSRLDVIKQHLGWKSVSSHPS